MKGSISLGLEIQCSLFGSGIYTSYLAKKELQTLIDELERLFLSHKGERVDYRNI